VQSVCLGTWDRDIHDSCGVGRVNEGNEGEGIWLMDFIYIYEVEQWNLLQLLQGGKVVGAI
jgi:hypothetical protein